MCQIDVCALRALEEIEDFTRSVAPARVTRFSIVGYSLGGLIARYLLGMLESRQAADSSSSSSYFDAVEPVNFTTFASPAIGIPQFPNLFSRFISFFGARLLSRTGEQIYAGDTFLHDRPLLEIMAQPDTSFYRALSRFRNKSIFANSVNDRTVPFATGGFPEDLKDPFARADKIARAVSDDPQSPDTELERGGMEFTFEEACPYIIKEWRWKEKKPKTKVQQQAPEPTHDVGSSSSNGPTDLSDDPDLDPLLTEHGSSSTRSRWRLLLPALPFFLRPSTFSGVPYRLGYLLPFFMPVLIPCFMVYIATRFLLQSRKSRTRIQSLLTGDLSTLEGQLRRVGLALEDTFEEIAEDVFPIEGNVNNDTRGSGDGYYSSDKPDSKIDAVLSPAQIRMTKNLNAIPGLKKYFVYLPKERNSHGAIICRDARWEGHLKGLEVLRWWASNFSI